MNFAAILASPGAITGVLSFLSVLCGLFGKPALGTFLNDPTTAQTVLVVAGGLGGLVGGILKGVHPVDTTTTPKA